MDELQVEPKSTVRGVPLIVFADDWGRHPSSTQHLVRHLLDRHEVTWVNTIGTRAVTLDPQLVKRGFEKLVQWSGQSAAAPAVKPNGGANGGVAPRVLSPVMYPGFRTGWQRRLNASLLAKAMHRRVANLSSTVILSSIPIVADLPELIHPLRWVYYCVDDFSAWPGLDAEPLRQMEEKLIAHADRIICAGDNLAARVKALGREAHVLSHGVDLEHWRATTSPSSLLSGLPHPIALFWGLLDRRLDVAVVRAVSEALRGGTVVLVGPQQDVASEIKGSGNVVMMGVQPYEELPALACAADVLIMPYADLPVTRAMQPLKMKEYLATGRPVVSTAIPAAVSWSDCMDVAADPSEFASAVNARVATGVSSEQLAARGRLQNEAWRAKALRFAQILFEDERATGAGR